MQTRLLIPCALGAFLAAAPVAAKPEMGKPLADDQTPQTILDESSMLLYPLLDDLPKDQMLRLDTDGDGSLSLDELEQAREDGVI